MNHPNPLKHLTISLIKSVIRIFAGFLLISNGMILAGSLFISAEVLGIIEELV